MGDGAFDGGSIAEKPCHTRQPQQLFAVLFDARETPKNSKSSCISTATRPQSGDRGHRHIAGELAHLRHRTAKSTKACE
jgi:hypothetical protein